MDVSPLLDSLNDAQRQAVAARPGHQLILAGAGSGKTRVLVHRIAWLIQVERVSPYSVMAVTFTNKAAREMRSRLEDLLGIAPRGLWVGTFHGLAHRLLKAHWQEAGLPQNFQILDSDDQLRLVKRVSQSLGLDDSRWPARQSQWFINSQKDEGLRPHHIQESGGDLFQRTMLQIYRAYEEACQRGGMVDFAEMLLRAHELWLNNPALLRHYQQRFPFILVDEFQDTNAVQYAWLRVLAGDQCFVTAVGDDDQSIYGWRGARIENIHQFSKDFPDTVVTRLEQNYRSTNAILKAANAVIANNASRLGKELWSDSKDGELIDLYSAFNEQDEARFIVERIKDFVQQGNSYRDTAVLYRSNAQSRVLEEAFLTEGVAYRIYGGQRFYERLEIRNALAYLRLIANRFDDAAFERVINTPPRGIGGKTLDTLRERARDEGCSLWEASKKMLAGSGLTARAANAVRSFIDLVDRLDREGQELTLEELAEQTLQSTGLYDYHGNEKGEKGQARVENLEELVNACRVFTPEARAEDEEERSQLQEFLDTVALDAGDTQADEFEDAVQMMTLHSAKGLEFPLVILAGMEENLFPHRMSAEDPDRLEEERRLCYVGITRGMEKLIITHAEARRLHGKESFNRLSRFVREIPTDLINEIRINSSISRPVSYRPYASSMPVSPTSCEGLQLGQRVRHSLFGEGVVVHFEGQGGGARVQVNFDGEGSKWLVLQYAKLEAL
ncbi:DNA helicase II [Gilvimarinus sp. F26214L]|uniref:DNA helicase II n=1 Tax=Gilvimarinus sp. DZF01 TaxID=3461371 RepID=UPI0040465556